MEWLMLHIGDPDFEEPLVIAPASQSAEKAFDPEMIAMITSMGFTEKQSKKALNGTYCKYLCLSDFRVV
jgi:uncharacterized UBP type Zn finger protein